MTTLVIPEFREAKYPGPSPAFDALGPGSRAVALGRDDS
jgi:hypothetical protein